MACSWTDDTNVALYDTVSGHAFGEVFDSADDAQAFLQWTEETGHADPRSVDPATLTAWREKWQATQ